MRTEERKVPGVAALLIDLRGSGKPNWGNSLGTLRVLGQVVEVEERLGGRCGRKQRKGHCIAPLERRAISRNGGGAAEFPKGYLWKGAGFPSICIV